MALQDVIAALAPRPQVMPAVPPPVVAGGMGFPQRSFGMGFTQVAGPADDALADMMAGDTSAEGSFQPGEIEPMQITPSMGALEGGGRVAVRPPPAMPRGAKVPTFDPWTGRTGFVRPEVVPAVAQNPRAVIGSNSGGLVPGVSSAYPMPGPPTLNYREGGKLVTPALQPDWRTKPPPEGQYYGKAQTPQEAALIKASGKVQKQIEAGNYKPYFDPAKRYDVDPSKYPVRGTATPPKAAKTVAELAARTSDPELAQRLITYYNAGKDDPGAVNWYMMGQLEKEFIKEYGPKEGRAQFQKKFADQMAATTGGSDPTANFRNAMYANFQQNQGLRAVPEASHQLPSPIGGRYVGGNMAMADKFAATPLTPENPKRYNFSGNFLGDRNAVTLDEQMSNILQWKKKEFSGPEYRPHEQLVQQVAASLGIDPRELQEVGWAGYKKTHGGGSGGQGKRSKPMIEIVNEAVERTAQITGVPPAEVVRRGIVRSEMPLFGAGGIAIPIGALFSSEEDAEAAEPTYRTGGRF